jgi:integrase
MRQPSTAQRNARTRAEASERRCQADARHAVRLWALANNVPVKATGRLPRVVLDAWQASAAVGPSSIDAPETVNVPVDAGRAQVAQAYRLLRMILGHAVREGRIDANPCQIARAGRVKSTDRVPATPAEIAALAAAMPERYAAAVHVAAWSGLRAGELFGLARRHVDLDAGTVRVEAARKRRGPISPVVVTGPLRWTTRGRACVGEPQWPRWR